ncbi:PEBP-like protein [Atractiella rhizophila]|nr:PEBP-like protein [Atractiella rhizophila]
MYSKIALISTLIPFLRVYAQSIPTTATELQLQTVDAQYDVEGFSGTDPTTAFGIDLLSQALLTIVYPTASVGVDSLGKPLTAVAVSELPQAYITPSTEHLTNFTSATTFTVTLADASALGHPDAQGNFRHYLKNGVTLSAAPSAENQTAGLVLGGSGGNTVTFYAGPGPNAGEGPHRYAWLVFREPQGFTAPAEPSSSEGAAHWSLSSYVTAANLGTPVAAAFFTVENGQATYSVAPTSSVNPQTLPAATETKSNEVSIQNPTGTTGTGAPGSTTTGGGNSAAGKVGVSVVAAVGALVALAL